MKFPKHTRKMPVGSRTGLTQAQLEELRKSPEMEFTKGTWVGSTPIHGIPFFLHLEGCERGCDYQCNPDGVATAQDAEELCGKEPK